MKRSSWWGGLAFRPPPPEDLLPGAQSMSCREAPVASAIPGRDLNRTAGPGGT
jgi:hypothetical protein